MSTLQAIKPGAVRYKLDRHDDSFSACRCSDLTTYGWTATLDGDAIDGGYCSRACAMASAKRHAERSTLARARLMAQGWRF